MIELALKLAFYLLPAYFANCSAMLMGGKTPLDMNLRFLDGKPLLGTGKTFKGTFFGIFTGGIVATLLGGVFPEAVNLLSSEYAMLGVLLAIGAVIGDAVASFIKRRMNIPRGKEVILLDQWDFVIGAVAFGSVLYLPTVVEFAAILIATFVAHKISNFVAYKARLKRVPW